MGCNRADFLGIAGLVSKTFFVEMREGACSRLGPSIRKEVMKFLYPSSTLLAILSLVMNAGAAVSVDPIFSDHMVLQRDLAVPVWGKADPGEKVKVSFRGQSKETVANEKGEWMIRLDPLKIGPAADLIVEGKTKTTFQDVLVGEVWLGSGQSNMAGGAGGYSKRDLTLKSIIDKGPYSKLRLYASGKWQVADSSSMSRFSAIHLSFGYALQKELEVPVGLFYGAVGGTPSGRWLSAEMAADDKELDGQFKKANGYSLVNYEEQREALVKKWQEEVKKAKAAGKRGPRGPVRLGDLYQSKIERYVPYGMRGVLWDQGESKTQVPGVPNQFVVMRALINGWRKVWAQGDFHFLHVQKPSGGVAPWDPENPVNAGAKKFNPQLPKVHVDRPNTLAYPLEHVKMGTLSNAPLVTALDLGTGVHPANKSGYGQRVCRVALGSVYGKKVAVCGPVYRSHKVEGSKIRVSFDHSGQGLAFRHAKELKGFEIAGEDGKWQWAKAEIDGNAVLLSHPDVTKPKNARYAFNRDPSFANLYNKDGLPGLPFTSVDWKY